MLRWIRFKIAWLKWEFAPYFTPGDPLLGADRETRNENIRLLHERHAAREPKLSDF